MCRLKFIRDNGCFPHQKLISCAVEHNRLQSVYGLGEVMYVCNNKQGMNKFVSDVYPESGIQIINSEDLESSIRMDIDTLYVESELLPQVNNMLAILTNYNVNTIVLDE